jgi:hypothetical protein
VVVEVRGAEACFGSWSRPYRVDTALTATVQRAVTVALIEGDEERRPSRLETVTVQNLGNEALQIIISESDRRRADATCTPHIITVIRRKPHEVGRRRRVEIVNQHTVGDTPTSTRIRENQLVTPSSITRNILEGDERVMYRLIWLMRTRVASRRNVLVFKISLPT